jgi:hypothetical protein
VQGHEDIGPVVERRAQLLLTVEDPRAVDDLPIDPEPRWNGALYYRLLWRGERLTRAEVEPLVDTVLAGFLR